MSITRLGLAGIPRPGFADAGGGDEELTDRELLEENNALLKLLLAQSATAIEIADAVWTDLDEYDKGSKGNNVDRVLTVPKFIGLK